MFTWFNLVLTSFMGLYLLILAPRQIRAFRVETKRPNEESISECRGFGTVILVGGIVAYLYSNWEGAVAVAEDLMPGRSVFLAVAFAVGNILAGLWVWRVKSTVRFQPGTDEEYITRYNKRMSITGWGLIATGCVGAVVMLVV